MVCLIYAVHIPTMYSLSCDVRFHDAQDNFNGGTKIEGRKQGKVVIFFIKYLKKILMYILNSYIERLHVYSLYSKLYEASILPLSTTSLDLLVEMFCNF